MKLFVTGVAGFVGKELCKAAEAAGYTVYGMDLPDEDVRSARVWSLIPVGAVVVHLAALSTEKSCDADPLEALDVNVAGTINVAKAALKRRCRQFIFASTEKVYPEGPEFRGEFGDFYPTTVYAASKLAAETALRWSGLPNVTVLRFGIAYGCRDSNWCAVEDTAAKVLRGESVRYWHPKTARRYVHVRDLCAGILASVGRTGHETFNLPGAELLTLADVWGMCCKVVGKWTPPGPDKGGPPSVRNPDGFKAKSLLGWEPKVPFAEGVREVVEYLKGRM